MRNFARREPEPAPALAVARALAAGVAGTAAMTVYQTAVAKVRGTEASTTPAEVGKRVIRGVFHRRFDEEQTGLLNNVMHWGYGTGSGRPPPAGVGQPTAPTRL